MMFIVKTPAEALELIKSEFKANLTSESAGLDECCGRTLAEDITACEYVPGFDRSTVDGYAVHAADTFGCSDSIPAILEVEGEILMGEAAEVRPESGQCAAIPTGGAVPEGCDAVVMIEYTEDYGDGTIGVLKPVSPGANMIYRGDDVFPGKAVLSAGRIISPSDVGALAAMGVTEVPVVRRPVAGIISTGDELAEPGEKLEKGRIRDSNGPMLAALMREQGADIINYGIVKDDMKAMDEVVSRAVSECDILLISGGTSVGIKDQTARIIEAKGILLVHGIAMKPGKPTILGRIGDVPVFGLPGHPLGAFFAARIYVGYLLSVMMGRPFSSGRTDAILSEGIGANHGREEYVSVRLEEKDGVVFAEPVHTKSGLITSMAGTDGYLTVPRDCEGYQQGEKVSITYYSSK